MKYLRKITLTLVLLSGTLSAPVVFANEKYNYENAERLKPLINWEDYSAETFNLAISENKPLFVLLTAPSWCYWCQVYESEDYLFAPQVIETINEKFVPVYIDADQRQDLTRQYLEGGWPSTTVMAPNRERLYGFSGVRPIPNMVANLNQAHNFVQTQGFANNGLISFEPQDAQIPTREQLTAIAQSYDALLRQASDPVYGGFGDGQKFPQAHALYQALTLHEETGQQLWLDIAKRSAQGHYTNIDELEDDYHLFDPVEGGFHRYGTARSWAPPHYEKMLYDNARLLRFYTYYNQIVTDDVQAQEMLSKTLSFMDTQWWDHVNGGFYGNSDVHGEDAYYGKNPRPTDKPRVEKTKYTDWNSEAVVAYLDMYQRTGNTDHQNKAVRTLDFLEKNLITEQGALHYYTPEGESGVIGSLNDNAMLALAFISAYEVLEEERYLKTAQKLVDYSLDNLYDWYAGGFFERNSPEIDQYAGDHTVLDKPTEMNGVMAYVLGRMTAHADDPRYLISAIETTGAVVEKSGTLDRGYYMRKAIENIRNEALLDKYENLAATVAVTKQEEQSNLWLNKLITNQEFVVSNEGIEHLSGPWLILAIVSLLAGLVSFLSPCSLPIVPAYVAYTLRRSNNRAVWMNIWFCAGLLAVFVSLGVGAAVVGGVVREWINSFSTVAGILMMLFGLALLFNKGWKGLGIKLPKPTSYVGSFAFGSVMGLSWTPCVGPILAAVLILASTAGSVWMGGSLLLLYGLGLVIPLMLCSYYVDRLNESSRLWRIMQGRLWRIPIPTPWGRKTWTTHSTTLVSALIFVVLGYLVASGTLFTFNQYIAQGSIQQWIFGLEEILLGWIK